ncbi:DUF411 domain-containing protein [Kiloniella sp.]|uniref:DUF411 domain-containing protein n=1 Tax=Kiloniella sp. TaxID=1938587 RepID=UPI003B0240A0
MKTIIAALFLMGTLGITQVLAASGITKEATLYKNPQCGCCTGYAEYLRERGYKVTVIPTENLSQVKQSHGISYEMESCHTMLIDGYVVEGHIPVNIVDKLLSERPDVTGIYLPGMPMGSPGMGGEKEEPFKVYSYTKGKPQDKRIQPFAVE